MRNQEIPPAGYTATQEERERIKEEYVRLLQMHKEYEKRYQTTGGGDFEDVVHNLLAHCNALVFGEWGEGDYETLNQNLQALRDYFELLDRYPDFRNSEITNPEGHFPEITREYVRLDRKAAEKQMRSGQKAGKGYELRMYGLGIGIHVYYVQESKKKLEAQSKKDPDKS